MKSAVAVVLAGGVNAKNVDHLTPMQFTQEILDDGFYGTVVYYGTSISTSEDLPTFKNVMKAYENTEDVLLALTECDQDKDSSGSMCTYHDVESLPSIHAFDDQGALLAIMPEKFKVSLERQMDWVGQMIGYPDGLFHPGQSRKPDGYGWTNDRVSTGAVAVQGTGGAGGCAALKAAVDKGPVKVPVAVDVQLKYYAAGILSYGECTQATDEFIAESYEGDCGDGYFKLKVSNTDPFGPTFGEQGYVRMFMDDSTKGNRCIYTGSVDQTAVDVMV